MVVKVRLLLSSLRRQLVQFRLHAVQLLLEVAELFGLGGALRSQGLQLGLLVLDLFGQRRQRLARRQ